MLAVLAADGSTDNRWHADKGDGQRANDDHEWNTGTASRPRRSTWTERRRPAERGTVDEAWRRGGGHEAWAARRTAGRAAALQQKSNGTVSEIR